MGKATKRNPMATHPVARPGIEDPHSVLPRDGIDTWHDGDIPEESRKANTVCSRCGAVYENQRWQFDEQQRDLLVNSGVAHEVVCPGCKKIAERNPSGIITLRGDYWQEHREEILNLIRNEEARGMNNNPIARIMDIYEEDGELVIQTTNEKLAQRIGRKIDQAHNGKLEYKWSQDNQLVRVNWERSLDEE
jgi:NMD protein affecting ribosome stability and mRNA decay